jgi:putative hemolysin
VSSNGALALAVAVLVAGWLLCVLAALLERSGPIRLRHWAQEAGPTLRTLYSKGPRFEAYRFLLSLSARLALACFFALMAAVLLLRNVAHPLPWAFGALFVMVASVEIFNRHLVGRAPESALAALTPIFRWLAMLLSPLLPLVAPLLPTPVTEQAELEEEASRAEIDAFIDVGRREGILEPGEGELVRGVVDFGDTVVRSVMTPRIDMICAPVDMPPTAIAELVLRHGHTRLPMYRSSIDEIVGILHVREILRLLLRRGGEEGGAEGAPAIEELLQPPHFVPETKSLAQLLRELQERHQEVAIVVDEYGGTQGLVTVEDLLEEVFGEMGDTGDGPGPLKVALPDGSWRLDGRAHLEDVEELFGVRLSDGEWETVGGLIFGLLGHVPRVGENVESHGLRFTVEGADHRRARRVRVERLASSKEEAEVG